MRARLPLIRICATIAAGVSACVLLTQSKTACRFPCLYRRPVGEKVAHGQPLGKIFTDESELLDVVEKAILFFREQGRTGERFADTIERLGFGQVERELLEGNILDRKQEILDAQLHLTGGATC